MMKRIALGLVAVALLTATLYAAGVTKIYVASSLTTTCIDGNLALKTGTGKGLYWCDAGTWTGPVITTAGAGTVTNTGTLTSGKAVIGNGGADVSVSSASGVAHLSSGTLSGSNVDLASEVTGVLPSANGGVGARSFGITIDGAGSTITTGVKGFIQAPVSGTIASWTLLSTDASATAGSIVLEVDKDVYANYPPDGSDKICASACPTLSSVNKNTSSSLGTWTTAVTAGDVFGFNVTSVSTVSRVTLVLTYQ